MESRIIMDKKRIEKQLNEQLNKEFYSSYLYLAMSAYCESISLPGFAHWMKTQAQEELFHAMKFYDYINERGFKVDLLKIDEPEKEWESPLNIFEEVLKHEQFITDSINNLVNIAEEEKDHATRIFLNWFVSEQVEEEASVDTILQKLKLTGGKGSGLFMIDKELSTRVFTPPATEE